MWSIRVLEVAVRVTATSKNYHLHQLIPMHACYPFLNFSNQDLLGVSKSILKSPSRERERERERTEQNNRTTKS